jgi:Tol biopolymer transport system component
LKDFGGNGGDPRVGVEVLPGAVRAHVGKILASKEFVHADSLRRFLSYTVEKAIDGEPGCLKESLLGTQLFGRGDAFDPRIDPIVRVQAGKLRSRLQRYYDGEGRSDTLVIDFPKGGYVPVFRPRTDAAPPADIRTPARRSRLGWLGVALIGLVALSAVTWKKWSTASSTQPTFTQLTFATASTAAFPSISREGKLVVFASDRGERGIMDLFIQAVGGEGPVQLTRSPATNRQPDISPDGTRIVFQSDRDGGGIYVLSLLSRLETKLADRGYNPRFSPDGSRIAYQGPGDKVYTVAAMGGIPQAVGSANSPATFPLWTRDGKCVLALVRISDTEFDWLIIPLAGGRPFSTGARDVFRRQQLGSPNHLPIPGDWLGDKVIFSAAKGDSASLWELPLSPKTFHVSGAARQLTSGPGAHTYPRVAPDAAGHARIVFVNENIVTQISSFTPNLNHPEENPILGHVTQDSSLVAATSPQLSADGSKLAFCSTRLGNRDVWLKDLKSGAETPVAANPWPEEQPAISPDGSRVAYLSRPNAGDAIQIWDAPGGANHKLCDACGAPIQWMPDGEQILVAVDSPPRLQVWNALTGEKHNLLPALKRPIRDIAITPDGRWMAVNTRATSGGTPDGCPQAFVVPFEVESTRSCNDGVSLTGLGSIWGLHWSQAGDLLYFFSMRDGTRCVWAQRLPLPSRRPVGQPFAVQHFHRYQPSPWSGGGISTAGGRFAVWFQDAQSSIWLAELH